jgi:CheY-like chemotaxis protein
MAKILVAEDESDIRELIRHVLMADGHEVRECASGPEALAALEKESVDLLLLDVMLPGMDGHTLQLRLSQAERTRSLPVIVLSALGFAKDMFAKFPQVREFIVKPFHTDDLLAAVRRVLTPVA